ncbi:hypothetical protein [Chitinophaga sp. MM2321]|uniref:hypothetical protein n=1 Tax=Chitinophaga sp. MM2321 TaxID=3137178 RepID=UPI0032D58BB8
MKKYFYCLLIPVLITACSTNKNKQAGPLRLTTITIHGDTIPQYTFRYDSDGHLVELVKHNQENDTNTTTFTYDSSNRITGMVATHQDNRRQQIQQRATVKTWDKHGNVEEVQYYDGTDKPVRTAKISWQKGLPVAMKYSDSTQAISWDYTDGNPNWKNLCTDSVTGGNKDTSIFVRSANYEWDTSTNPLRPLVNQLLLGPGISPVPVAGPFADITYMLLHISANNPTLIKVAEKEKSVYKQYAQEYQRQTTIQFFYAYNRNGYPENARVHLHTEGYTKLGTDTQLTLDYLYQ